MILYTLNVYRTKNNTFLYINMNKSIKKQVILYTLNAQAINNQVFPFDKP